MDPAEELGRLLQALRAVAPPNHLPPDAFVGQALLRVELVFPDGDHGPQHPAESLRVDPARRGQGGQHDARQFSGFDPHGEVHLLGGGEERDPTDLLQIHPDGVVAGVLEGILPARRRHAVGPGHPVEVLRRDVDDLDALFAELLLQPDQEVLDLLGCQGGLGKCVEQIVRGDETAVATLCRDALSGLRSAVVRRVVDRERCGEDVRIEFGDRDRSDISHEPASVPRPRPSATGVLPGGPPVRPVRDLQMREGSSTSRQSPRPRRRAFTNVSH